VSTNTEYFFPVSNDKSKGFFENQVSSYDLYAPPWATIPDVEFEGQDRNPFVAGEFVWTGFDYLGERLRSGMTGRFPGVPISASWICADSRKTGSTSIRHDGGRSCRWLIYFHTGTGRIARNGHARPRLHLRR